MLEVPAASAPPLLVINPVSRCRVAAQIRRPALLPMPRPDQPEGAVDLLLRGPSIAAVTVLLVVLGAAVGWWLCRTPRWCPHCGHDLVCSRCRRRPGDGTR
ncbi:hypothetical protein [Krasilnikovia cinnamomea]|uniref:hypothetical protein n=1 Tax=Krasilnikovia cinnamomea TaxID=349313 RepID=UPI00102C96AB|nr:hypothetical protein [Krasilnikovia cinnamomea]